MSFDNQKLTKFDLYDTVTMSQNNTGWNEAYSTMQRASIDDWKKAVRLHQTMIDRKNGTAKKRQKEDRKVKTFWYAKSPKRFFRKKNGGRQPAIRSFPKLIVQNSTMNLEDHALRLKTNEFDGMECLSFQIIETTKKITKRIRPENRTYELRVQFQHYQEPRTEGSTIGIDIGVHNMLATAPLEIRSMKLVKITHDAKRYKHDDINHLLSKRSRVKRNGRKWTKITRKIKRLLKRQQNVKTDCIRQTISKKLEGAKTVVIEDLDVASMLAKVKNSGIVPKKGRSGTKAGKSAVHRRGRNKGSRGLRRAVQNASLGTLFNFGYLARASGIRFNQIHKFEQSLQDGWQSACV